MWRISHDGALRSLAQGRVSRLFEARDDLRSPPSRGENVIIGCLEQRGPRGSEEVARQPADTGARERAAAPTGSSLPKTVGDPNYSLA